MLFKDKLQDLCVKQLFNIISFFTVEEPCRRAWLKLLQRRLQDRHPGRPQGQARQVQEHRGLEGRDGEQGRIVVTGE